ncbi:MAG: hypothetical protein ACLPZM_06610 [Thermoplasmata archaeon]
MALFSDMDWVILLAVAAFLLFGKQSGEVLRTMGRWYGRAGRLKQELLAEFTKAADLPTLAPGANLSFRSALMSFDSISTPAPSIPTAVSVAPSAPVAPSPVVPSPDPWTGGYPIPTWSMTIPVVPTEVEVSR